MNAIYKILIFAIMLFSSYEKVYPTTHPSSQFSRKTALVYCGPGVFDECRYFLCRFFEERKYDVRTINAEEISEGTDWREDCEKKILAFPGGAAGLYQELLKGKGCDNIKRFVENGGVYVGVCGGGYFAASKVEFALGTPEQVNEPRELGFFPGIARGPVIGTFKYSSRIGASATLVKSTSTREPFYVFYNGGQTFVPFDNDPNFKRADPRFTGYEVLATYSEVEDKPAIIKCSYGKGYAILSGVHFETPSVPLSEGLIKQAIQSTETVMKRFLDGIFLQSE